MIGKVALKVMQREDEEWWLCSPCAHQDILQNDKMSLPKKPVLELQ